jgi:hypothetical protein
MRRCRLRKMAINSLDLYQIQALPKIEHAKQRLQRLQTIQETLTRISNQRFFLHYRIYPVFGNGHEILESEYLSCQQRLKGLEMKGMRNQAQRTNKGRSHTHRSHFHRSRDSSNTSRSPLDSKMVCSSDVSILLSSHHWNERYCYRDDSNR